MQKKLNLFFGSYFKKLGSKNNLKPAKKQSKMLLQIFYHKILNYFNVKIKKNLKNYSLGVILRRLKVKITTALLPNPTKTQSDCYKQECTAPGFDSNGNNSRTHVLQLTESNKHVLNK